MPLFKTTKDNDHDHIVYVTEKFFGITSIDNGHKHAINPDIHTEDGLPYPKADLAQYISKEPADITKNHTHEVIDYVIATPAIRETEQEIVNDVLVDYVEAYEAGKESTNMGYICENMYANKQWNTTSLAKIKKDLEDVERAAITINEIENGIDSLAGYQSQNKMDIFYSPTEGGDQRKSDVLNIITKHDLEQCDYPHEESKIFEDMQLVGLGHIHPYIDYNDNENGKIIVERFKWDEVKWLPHSKDNASDSDGYIKEKWFTEAKIKGMWEDKFEEFSATMQNIEQSTLYTEWQKELDWQNLINKNLPKYKVLERWRKEYYKSYIIRSSETGERIDAKGWSTKDVNRAKSISGMFKIAKTNYRLRRTVICGITLLEDEYLDQDYFQMIPVYAKYRDGAFRGKVEIVIEAQVLLNKSYSLFVDIVQKMSGWGWWIERTMFSGGDREYNKWKKKSSSSGWVAELDNIDRRPIREEATKFPTELLQAIEMFSATIRRLMNINLEFQGLQPNQGQSGVAFRQQIVQQLLGNDYLFESLKRGKKQLARILVKLYRKIYKKPERMLRILVSENSKKNINLGTEEYAKGTLSNDPEVQQTVMEILSDATMMDNDVEIIESPYSPSSMMRVYWHLADLQAKGMQMPLDIILPFMPVPQTVKDQLLDSWKQFMQAEQAKDNRKYEAEEKKTAMANIDKLREAGAM